MNEHDLDLTLDGIGADRTRVTTPPALRERVRGAPLRTPRKRGWLLPLPGWIPSMFGASRFVVAGAIVALFGGLLLMAQPFERQETVPGSGLQALDTLYSPTGSLSRVRVGHTATLLSDGRVLIVGGSEEAPATAEVWDPGGSSVWPEPGAFSPAGSLTELRDAHTATLLEDGRVLIIGYDYAAGDPGNTGTSPFDMTPDTFPASAEVWDPATSTFSPAGSLATARDGHIATLLPDGRVLVLGGEPISTEIWDPATSTFSPAGAPDQPRSAFIHAALADGRVLIVEESGEARVWDATSDTMSQAGSHALGHPDSATLLPDGRLLVFGVPSEDFVAGSATATLAAIWDPATSAFSPAGSLVEPRIEHQATALPDGRVLISAGCFNEGDYCYPGDGVESVEIWDPETEVFSTVGVTRVARGGGTVTALPDGRVLVVGGSRVSGWREPLDSAEVWDLSDR